MSILTVAELYAWVYLSDSHQRREQGLLAMLSDVSVLDLDAEIAQLTGKHRAALRRQGVKVPTIDMLIACTALRHNLTIVTHNQRHFSLVPGVRLEDWLLA